MVDRPDGLANSFAQPHRYGDTDSNPNAHCYPNPNAHRHTNPNAHRHTNPNAHAQRHADPAADTRCDRYALAVTLAVVATFR